MLQRQVLVCRVGPREIAFPAHAVLRIMRMAALTPLPGAPAGVAGLLSVHGDVLPVVDVRLHLGLPAAPPHPAQALVLLNAETRFLAWVDEAREIAALEAHELEPLATDEQMIATQVARLGARVVLVLDPERLNPGPLTLASRRAS